MLKCGFREWLFKPIISQIKSLRLDVLEQEQNQEKILAKFDEVKKLIMDNAEAVAQGTAGIEAKVDELVREVAGLGDLTAVVQENLNLKTENASLQTQVTTLLQDAGVAQQTINELNARWDAQNSALGTVVDNQNRIISKLGGLDDALPGDSTGGEAADADDRRKD